MAASSSSASASASASAASPASWDAATVLNQSRYILKVDKDGERADAIARAAALAHAQPSSAVAQNLAGDLYYNAGREALELIGDRSEIDSVVERFYGPAVVYYSVAAPLAPACVSTAISHADALGACGRHEEAYAEYRRAASTPDPADPAEYNAGMDFNRSSADSIRIVRATAQRSLRNFQKWVTRSYVPRQAMKVMMELKSDIPVAVQALKVANALAKAYPFCARAQLLRAHALLEQANTMLPQNLDKTPAFERALSTITEAANTFHHSLLIALFRAKLLYQLRRNDEAATECLRAISIRRPDDPAEENVLRIPGDVGRKSRVVAVKEEIAVVLKHLNPGWAGDLAENNDSDEDDDSDDEPIHHQSAIYAHNALHKPVRYEGYKPFGPLENPPDQIQFVAGEVVPQEIVNIFALHCQARSRCSKKKTVCHICSFELAYDARIESSDMSAHYNDKHVQKLFPQKKQDGDEVPPLAPEPTAEAVTCSEENCHVRTRSTKDMRLHYHFVHRLPAVWWIT